MINYFKFSKKKLQGFTILELLVVLAVIGVFSAFAYPNISNWINDRNVKKEVYETISFIKERKSEVASGKYGMIQVILKPNLEVYTMSPEQFSGTYHSVSSSSSYKTNKKCDYGTKQSGFVRDQSKETLKLSVSSNDSNSHVYPNAAHNPSGTVACITKDGTISYMGLRKTENDPSNNQTIDVFIFCSKSNSDQYSCNYTANLDFMYKITLDNFQNTKVYKKNKNNNTWMKIDG